MKSSKVKPPEGRRNRFIKKVGRLSPPPPHPSQERPSSAGQVPEYRLLSESTSARKNRGKLKGNHARHPPKLNISKSTWLGILNIWRVLLNDKLSPMATMLWSQELMGLLQVRLEQGQGGGGSGALCQQS
ncbi:hypothetical protein CDAR_290481 [Caerostris darwini]|uniref:Uncharacterized protein n=1 Tax=Caerostris darwini TaxID=1538125 RepID=A0AAV4N4L0_9ARAC|nr:hypothetical protein CDAR_290481 [Caerostris darwini]